MDLSNLTYPDGYAEPESIDTFETWVWFNSEVCNNCFEQIRHVGDEIVIENRAWTLYINEYYERTEQGSQEYAPGVPPASERFGQCFCLNCGSDTAAENHTLSTDVMIRRAKRLVRYLMDETPVTVDGSVVGQTIRDLKAVWSNQGYDSEIFAVAFTLGIRSPPGSTDNQAKATP